MSNKMTEKYDYPVLNGDELDGVTKRNNEALINDFTRISDYNNNINDQNEEMVKNNTLPGKGVVQQITTTSLAMDLSFASQAKSIALKMNKIEDFLSSIEDRLFNEETLMDLSKTELLNLYTSTRLMKSDAFKQMKEIRKDIDFENLEAVLLSMHAKEDINNKDIESGEVQSLLSKLFDSSAFLNKSKQIEESKDNEQH